MATPMLWRSLERRSRSLVWSSPPITHSVATASGSLPRCRGDDDAADRIPLGRYGPSFCPPRAAQAPQQATFVVTLGQCLPLSPQPTRFLTSQASALGSTTQQLAPQQAQPPRQSPNGQTSLRADEASAEPAPTADAFPSKPDHPPSLDSLFRSKPSPLGVGPNPAVAQQPDGNSLSSLALWALGYYNKESRLIRTAKALYGQIEARADDEKFHQAFHMDKSFRATHALLVLHVWLCLVRLRTEDPKDAAEVGQTLYELFNHECEKRMVATGVQVLISRWMRELEKNFYGASLAYDAALKPTAPQGALESALWRNVLRDPDSPQDPAAVPAQDPSSTRDPAAVPDEARALARYVRRELACLAMTEREAFMTGNIRFSKLA